MNRIRWPGAGREGDALVAEKVMGCRVGYAEVYRGKVAYIGNGPRWIDLGGGAPSGMVSNGVPRYTTDIAAAWKVVEKMEEEWATTLETDGTRRWVVRFWAGDEFNESGYRATAPEAICIAALRATGLDVDTEGAT